ncbi:MAG TPA: membrane dipeptidase [Gemmatimonadaceae bacterium]
MPLSRREFLRAAAASAAAIPLGGILPGIPGAAEAAGVAPAAPRMPGRAPLTPFPYVDGLTFFDRTASFRESGLSAIISDVSAIDGSIASPAGKAPRYARTFEASARRLTATRRALDAGEIRDAFLATHGREIRPAWEGGRTAVFLQFQSAEPVGEDLTRLDMFYELGLRVLQVTHHNATAWGGGALDPVQAGLTKTGTAGIERLNELGIIPDLSHAGDLTARDVLRASRKPVILSHGAARAIVDNARCAPDDVIRGVADSGGVMGVFMMTFWLTREPVPTAEHYVRQLRHIANVGGIDAVGIANDYDVAGLAAAKEPGMDNATLARRDYEGWWDQVAKEGAHGFSADTRPRHVVIPELNDVRRAFSIHRALDRAGFRTGEIEKVMGGNWTRVLTDALG